MEPYNNSERQRVQRFRLVHLTTTVRTKIMSANMNKQNMNTYKLKAYCSSFHVIAHKNTIL